MGVKIQYRGTSDVVRLLSGESWDGRLANPLAQTVQWDRKGHHIIDSEEFGLSDEAIMLILEDSDRFLDVTDLEVIPANGWQKMWGGVVETPPPAQEPAPEVVEQQDPATEKDEIKSDPAASEGDTNKKDKKQA